MISWAGATHTQTRSCLHGHGRCPLQLPFTWVSDHFLSLLDTSPPTHSSSEDHTKSVQVIPSQHTTMKTIITLAAFVGLIASVTGQYFRVFAEHSASAIHLLPWSASGQRIWLGKDTASYCPSVVVKNCPKGDYTNFVGGNGGLGMGTEVPGGQLVYIDPECGALG